MKKLLISTLVVLASSAPVVAWSGGPAGAEAAKSAKTARILTFCAADIAIDQATASVTNAADFLVALATQQSNLATMSRNLPPGRVGREARAVIKASEASIATDTVHALTRLPSTYGPDLDTYCHVDGTGDPLPRNFARGKNGRLCVAFLPLQHAIARAMTPRELLHALGAHQDALGRMTGLTPSLPTSVRPDAEVLVHDARTAIFSDNVMAMGPAQGDFQSLSLYCGIND